MPHRMASKATATLANMLVHATPHTGRRPIRVLVTVVVACALIVAGLAQGLPSAHAAPSATKTAVVDHLHGCAPTTSHGHRTGSSKYLVPPCMSDFGCLLVVSIPATSPSFSKHFSWSRVAYWSRAEFVRGIESKPILGPPIRRV